MHKGGSNGDGVALRKGRVKSKSRWSMDPCYSDVTELNLRAQFLLISVLLSQGLDQLPSEMQKGSRTSRSLLLSNFNHCTKVQISALSSSFSKRSLTLRLSVRDIDSPLHLASLIVSVSFSLLLSISFLLDNLHHHRFLQCGNIGGKIKNILPSQINQLINKTIHPNPEATVMGLRFCCILCGRITNNPQVKRIFWTWDGLRDLWDIGSLQQLHSWLEKINTI